jgi:hypothetical protein
MTTVASDSIRCRATATLAWLAVAGWYYVLAIAAWGWWPVAMLGWTPPALLVAVLTRRWLQRLGRSPSSRALRIWGLLWILVLGALFAAAAIPDLPIGAPLPAWQHRYHSITHTLSWVFPLSLTVWALLVVLRLPLPWRRHASPRPGSGVAI